jgi:hypothetical protein
VSKPLYRFLLLAFACLTTLTALGRGTADAQVGGCDTPSITPSCTYAGHNSQTVDAKHSETCASPPAEVCCKVGTFACEWDCVADEEGALHAENMTCSYTFCTDRHGAPNCCNNPNWCSYP